MATKLWMSREHSGGGIVMETNDYFAMYLVLFFNIICTLFNLTLCTVC